MKHFAFGARLAGQVLTLKSPAFTPVIVMPEMLRLVVPVLVSVTLLAVLVVLITWLPNDSEVAESVAAAGVSPVPESATVCWLPFTPLSLSVMVSVPFCSPTAVGVNVTEIEQLPDGESGVEQLSVSANPALAEIPEMDSGSLPRLVTVTVCVALLVPTFCGAKARLEGERTAAGTLEGAIFATKALQSLTPPKCACSGLWVGKSEEHACPVT